MSLTRKQKRYIKKNINKISLDLIIKNLNVPKEEVLSYFEERWREEKYEKIADKNEDSREGLKINHGSNLKGFLKANWGQLILLMTLIFITYFNALNNAFVSDDIPIIAKSETINNIQSVFENPYAFIRPLLLFITYRIGGLNPIYYRLINLFFHIGTTWLVYILIYLLASPIIALFTACIFAVHPIMVESVTWISGGPYPQYSFFCLLSLLAYILSKKNRKLYFISLIAFVLAVISSEKAIVLPFILIAYELSFSSVFKRIKEQMAFLILGGVLIILNVLRVGQRLADVASQSYDKTTRLENPFYQMPIAISSYLELILWPDKLTLYHSELVLSLLNFSVRAAVTILFFAAVIYSYKKNRLIFFWLSFFVISLIPTLTPLRISWVVAERYAYMAVIGIFFVIVYLLHKLLSKNKDWENIFYILVVFIIIALMTRSIVRNIDWKNEDNLWLSAGKISVSSPQNHNNLGDVYARHNNLPKAAEEFAMAVKLKPNYADAYHNLANTYLRMGKIDDALKNYEKALSISPNLWQSYQNIAVIYYNQKKYDRAEEYMKKAIKIMPTYAGLYANLGWLYMSTGKNQEAEEMFIKTLQIDPQNKIANEGIMNLKK
jgi:tetratricopeptide (TPR) repeat protein